MIELDLETLGDGERLSALGEPMHVAPFGHRRFRASQRPGAANGR